MANAPTDRPGPANPRLLAGPPEDRPIAASLALRPLVAEPGHPPKLVVEVTNWTPRPIPFMRFASSSCFARTYLAATLTTPSGKRVQSSPACAPQEWPGTPGILEPGAIERQEIALAALFPTVAWEKGRHGFDAEWRPQGLRDYENGKFVCEAQQRSLNSLSFQLAPVLTTFRIAKDAEAVLPDGARLTFKGHSHKRTHPGQASPLVIYGTWRLPKSKAATDFTINLFANENPQFSPAPEYVLELVSHGYDEWMELRYFGRLPEAR